MDKSMRITVTIDKELLEWIDYKVQQKIFANRSHALESLIHGNIEEK